MGGGICALELEPPPPLEDHPPELPPPPAFPLVIVNEFTDRMFEIFPLGSVALIVQLE